MAASSVACIVSLLLLLTLVDARIPGVYSGGAWQSAHATFYGGNDASGTMGIVPPTQKPLTLTFFIETPFPKSLIISSVTDHFLLLSPQEALVGTETFTAKATA
jgi:hypothetical protein